jgi:hypothetical protein
MELLVVLLMAMAAVETATKAVQVEPVMVQDLQAVMV